MLLLEGTILYSVIGVGVAVAVYLRNDAVSRFGLISEVIASVLFWPLFVPVLLSERPVDPLPVIRDSQEEPDTRDGLTDAISQVETELDAALKSLDGWAENVLASEHYRLDELRSAWKTQAARIRELDRLLEQPDPETGSLTEIAADNESVRRSEKIRRENVLHLKSLRKQMHADLIGTMAWVRELVTMIHLAKFSGAPASRAEELVAQIAAAVEGLSEVSTWREEPAVEAT